MDKIDDIKVNRVSIFQRLKPEITKKNRKKDLEYINTDSSQSNDCYQSLQNHPDSLLQEPEEKIKLFERAIGYFNADKDEKNQKNDLNQSVEIGPPYICKICQSWFYLGSKLKVHYILNHAYNHCDICSILFENFPEKQEHLSKFHRPFLCEICQKTFNIFEDLLEHYETDHNSSTCVFCGLLVQPKSLLQEHLTKKHQINENYLDANAGEFRFIETEKNPNDFFCNLCTKKRSIDVMFGHMFSFHKMALTSLMNLLAQTSGIKCDGSSKDVIKCEKEDGQIDSKQQEYGKYFCQTCGMKFMKKFPEDFHLIYCQGRLPCKYCRKMFSNPINREKHRQKNHEKFSCEQGCLKLAYNSEENLTKHYVKFHENVGCNYCDKFINSNEYDNHLEDQHKYKAKLMKNFKDTLFEIMDKNNKHIIVCCLCDENITLLTEQPKNIYLHYEKIHQMSQKKILQLCTVKPVIEDYEQMYREINENIPEAPEIPETPETSKQIKLEMNSDSSEIEEKLDSEIDENKDKIVKDFSHLESEIESDFDVEETEGILYSEYEEDSEQYCELCSEEFENMFELIKHLNEKHKLKIKYTKIECKYCKDKHLVTNIQYAKHVQEFHETNLQEQQQQQDEDSIIIKCNICNTNVLSLNIRHHLLQKHHPNVSQKNLDDFGLKCRFCDLKFWHKHEINAHETSEHFDESNADFFQKCFSCQQIFSNEKCLKEHCFQAHPDESQFTNLFFKCLQCFISFPNIELTRKHFRIFHPFLKIYKCPVPQCYKTTKRAKYITKHLKSPHNFKPKKEMNSRSCDVCKKEFKTFRAASIHKLMKHQRKLYFGFQCRICQEKFQTMEQRKLHYSTAHPGQLAYTCLECGKGFISKSGLYGHRKIHQEHETLTCPYCNKEFTRRDSYNEHLLIHIGPRHQCPHCPKSFTQRSNLTRHVRIHTGAKPYQCTYCDKRFSDKGACRSHERVHTKEEHCECSYCGKKFTKKQKLKYHIKFHTGEGLVNCEVCNKQFSNSYSLNEHRRIHNQQTLVMCNCGRGFTSEKYLQRHITNVHNDSQAKYVCPICFKTLLHKSSYNDHIMTHTSVKHIKCMLCNHEYNTKKTVKRHLLEKHNIDAIGAELNKYIYQLKPEDVGLNVPSASEMEINVNDILLDKSLVSIDLSHLQKLETFKNKPKVTNTAKRAKMKEAYIANTLGPVQNIQIKEEPKTDEELEMQDSDDESDDDVVLEARKKSRKFKKPKKYKVAETPELVEGEIEKE